MKHHYVTCKTANNFGSHIKLPPFPLLCYLQKEKYLKTDSRRQRKNVISCDNICKISHFIP